MDEGVRREAMPTGNSRNRRNDFWRDLRGCAKMLRNRPCVLRQKYLGEQFDSIVAVQDGKSAASAVMHYQVRRAVFWEQTKCEDPLRGTHRSGEEQRVEVIDKYRLK